MPKPLQETGRITEAAIATSRKTGRLPVQLISPGWGSSGYYSAEVLEQAVADDLFPAGTHMYADHPTKEEAKARPVRSIKDLMSVTATPGRIATDDDITEWGADLGAVVAEVDVLPAYREVVEHIAGAIGVSIRGDGELTEGTAEGRTGPVVESLLHVQSVDWVTRAGRGGRVLSLVESARAATRAIARGLSEATVNDTREALQTALRDAYGSNNPTGPNTYVWVRDFDDTKVWFEVDGPGDVSGLYEQSFSQADTGAVTLSGDRTEVRVRTTYVPVARPGSTTTTESLKEDAMPQIEEARLRQLEADAGRVTALEERATTAESRATVAEAALATRDRRDRATTLIAERATEAGVSFSALECRGLLAELPLTEAGELDEAAFTTTVDEAAAERKASAGAGRVIGHGGSARVGKTGLNEAEFWADIDTQLGLTEQKGA